MTLTKHVDFLGTAAGSRKKRLFLDQQPVQGKDVFSQQSLRACDFTMLLLGCHSTEKHAYLTIDYFIDTVKKQVFWDRESVLTELELVDKRR